MFVKLCHILCGNFGLSDKLQNNLSTDSRCLLRSLTQHAERQKKRLDGVSVLVV